MMSEKEKTAIQDALERIGKHSLFANSSVYTRLLNYLVEKALINEDVKEFTIGLDLFSKNYSLDKNDGTVRSYVYNLRKKLDEFYSKEGADEPIIFKINKGQYNLNFISQETFSKQKKTTKATVTIPLQYLKLVGFSIIIIGIIIGAGFYFANKPAALWKSYFDSNAKNLVVVSDQYVVHEKLSDGRVHGVIYANINNGNEFVDYTTTTPINNLQMTDYTLMSKMAPYCIKSIADWFSDYNSDFDLKLESELNYDDITQNNILFIGQFKTMNMSKTFFLKDSKAFKIFNDGFEYSTNGKTILYDTQQDKNSKKEYAMVSCISLSKGKTALYFVSNNDIGVMATVKQFTDKEYLDDFQKQLGNNAKYFNALFEVSGLQRTDVSCKMVALEILN
ncbi:hypothetical protein [Flavobacterium sp. 7A]|uniref:hypothetical protein n=1 Tax=Flavobacterium sp. 7A TaxID=2940571 RepID=UPI002226AF0B|nr:hypothetical protein [Flavobacterium sp. 7A]MCW2120632.1 hypothetical protein [Flavobacterium sp. 7A]